jgi:HEAT repeat protein
LDERKKAILALAQDGSPAALAALKAALGHSAPEIRQAIAASLGQCHSREAVAMLKALLSDPDEAVARSAVRSLAGGDQPGAAPAVVDLLNDPNASVDLRCEAALALGDLKEPWVLDPLSRAAKESEDEDVIKAALDGIAKLDFSASRPFFEDYLRSPDVASDLRIEAIDALAQVSGDPTSFLAQLAANDADPDIRAAAARAMSATEATGNAGPELLSLLRNESDPDVRLRLYQALLNQQSFDTATALALVQNEQDPATLVAGLDALAKALRDNPNPQLQNYFNQTAVPELKQIALTGQSLDDRQEAVIALTRAHTPEAMAALAEVAQQMAQQQKAAQNTAQAQANPANAAPTSPQKPQSQSP